MSSPYLIPVSAPVHGSAASDAPVTRPTRVELPQARAFVEKSVSEDTRRAYARALLDFFAFVRKYPAMVTVEDLIAYRDELVKKRRRKARTVAMKLSVVRAYFGYLKAAGDHAGGSSPASHRPRSKQGWCPAIKTSAW